MNPPVVPVVNLPPSVSPPVAPRIATPIPEPPVVLHATFIEDITVPDGQVFPPGAEFVKTWKMLNDSDKPWPENTELVYVAGDTLSRGSTSKSVGFVAGNTEVELSTGELKVRMLVNMIGFELIVFLGSRYPRTICQLLEVARWQRRSLREQHLD